MQADILYNSKAENAVIRLAPLCSSRFMTGLFLLHLIAVIVFAQICEAASDLPWHR